MHQGGELIIMRPVAYIQNYEAKFNVARAMYFRLKGAYTRGHITDEISALTGGPINETCPPWPTQWAEYFAQTPWTTPAQVRREEQEYKDKRALEEEKQGAADRLK